ncbi:MAG: type II toxin-antitoxin system RelE/ParE family toxin [Elusimicrobia bacterium]|nr:type II toxin-antitoxin system RelE/ParE family toxin [Elusimicrobiota bacterium]
MKAVIRTAARRDILSQFLYLIEQGVPHVAERFIDAVDESIAKLTKRPRIGAPKPDRSSSSGSDTTPANAAARARARA